MNSLGFSFFAYRKVSQYLQLSGYLIIIEHIVYLQTCTMQRGHIWQLLAGISLFLFALDIIEGVAKASNDVIRRKIESFTNTTVKAFLT